MGGFGGGARLSNQLPSASLCLPSVDVLDGAPTLEHVAPGRCLGWRFAWPGMQGDFMKLPFKDNSFDAVYAIEATCHAPQRHVLVALACIMGAMAVDELCAQ